MYSIPLIQCILRTMIPDEALRTRLALNNESVQIQVCSDYNFHSEEQFKINYWTKVFETFSSNSNLLGPLSGSTIRTWWGSNVQPRTLPGLEKILFQAVRENKIFTASEILSRYHQLYRPVSSSMNEGASSIPRKAVSMIGSLARGVWNLAIGSEPEDHTDHRISADEIFFLPERIEKFSQKFLDDSFNSSSNETSQLITEDEIRKRIERTASDLVEDINVHGVNEGYPFARISAGDMAGILTAILVEKFDAIPFIAGDNIKCVKIFCSNKKNDRMVTEADKAYIVSKAAIARLTDREAELNKRWSNVDTTIREHLKCGRKNLALTALRERKMIEKQIDDVQIYKLKLQETSSMTETAMIQKIVVDAIAETSKAGKATLIGLEKQVQDVVDEATEVREQVNEIGTIIGGSTQVEDDECVEEYEKLVHQLEQEKEKEMEQRLTQLAIPTVPSEIPVSPVKETRAPQILIEDR